MPPRFAGRSALLTAAADGLGWATARRLLAEGARVVVWDRDPAAIERAGREEPVIELRMVDLTDATAITEAAAAAGDIDILVNNAGGSLHTPNRFLEQTDEDWQRVMALNVDAAVRVTRAVLPGMIARRYGRIVNLGSKAGRFGSLFAGANYAASKGAVQAFTLQIAQEFGPLGITCNAICPGAILTPRVERLLAERQSPAERQKILGDIPVRRHGRVEDVAAAVAYLAAEEAGFVTGVMLDVNGGQVMSI
jgi:NAD(P)-dependent dehydrogenase (short-subunit alcohol dehydrogenase family)